MSWNRINVTGMTIECERFVAEAHDVEHSLSGTMMQEHAWALLELARALPEMTLDPNSMPIESGWQGARSNSGNGVIEITCWKEQTNALVQGEWQEDKRHSLLIQIGEQTWISDAAYLKNWSFDPNAPIEIFEKAEETAAIREKTEVIVKLWEEKQHPKQGWVCRQCGWQNLSSVPACAVCQAPVHTSASTVIEPWATLGGTPPPTFTTAPSSDSQHTKPVELDAPPEIQDLINQLTDTIKDKLIEKARDKTLDALKEKTEQPQQCWRCKSKLRSSARYCDKCGADQHQRNTGRPNKH
jgi:hypothetical protein